MKIEAGKTYKTRDDGTFVKVVHVMDHEDLQFITKAEDDNKKNPVIGFTEFGQLFCWQRDGEAPGNFGTGFDLVPVDYEPQKVIA